MSVILVVILFFFADSQFNSAKKLEYIYLWQDAEEKYQLAIKLDPFNTQYYIGYGNFIREKYIYQKERICGFLNAEKLYARASELNPRCAECALHLGQVRLALFLLNEDEFSESLFQGLGDFRKALINDPLGFSQRAFN